MTTRQKIFEELMNSLYLEFNKANEEFAKIDSIHQELYNKVMDQREVLGKMKGIGIALEILRKLWIDDINGEDK